MNLENIILSGSAFSALLSLYFVPRNKILETQFIIIFVQLPTWLLGLSAVELGLLQYPYRELASVNRTSFLFEYFIFPVICAHFSNYYPERASVIVRMAYLAGTSLALTGVEVLLEHHTLLIKYTGWHWYWTLLSVGLILGLTKRIVQWFFFQSEVSE